jgi:Tfp pilus assembly protein PilF
VPAAVENAKLSRPVTLIMTYASPRRIFQSGDFRLTNPRLGYVFDYPAQKQIFVQRFDWTALVGFCGIAHTGNEWVPEWIVGQLRMIPEDAPFEDLVARLHSAEAWLTNAIPEVRGITFSVGAFVDFRPTLVLISNFEALNRQPRPIPAEFPAALEVTRLRPRRERLFLSGRPSAVLRDERRWLLATLKDAPHDEGYAALAEVNRRASQRDEAVGRVCFTSHVTVLGESGGVPHDWPEDQDFLPAFVDVHGMILPRLRRGVDEHGRPKPLQYKGGGGTVFKSSAEYFRVALEEKPTDPSVLSNYGNWLRSCGELEEAEAAYRKAIASGDAFASAHGNLAILLDERGDLDAAEREHRRAVDLDSQSPIHSANLAFFLWARRGESATGETLLQGALARERNAFTVGRLARFTDLALGDQDAAQQLYEEALDMAPNDPWINGRFADFLRRTGDVDNARDHFERAVAGEHPDPEALGDYAELEASEGSLDRAVELIRRLLKLRPRHPGALAFLGATRTLQGAADAEAERMYRQSLDWDTKQPVAALNLAQLLLRRNADDEEARRLLVAAGDADLSPELRLERFFYAVAYGLDGFEGAANEIRLLLDAGARITSWDLSAEVAAAKEQGHPQADLLAKVAGL